MANPLIQVLPQPQRIVAGRYAHRRMLPVRADRFRQAERLQASFERILKQHDRLREHDSMAPVCAAIQFVSAVSLPFLPKLLFDDDELELVGDWPVLSPPQEDFYYEEHPDRFLHAQRYTLLASAAGCYALCKRWERYRADRLRRGEHRWTEVFDTAIAVKLLPEAPGVLWGQVSSAWNHAMRRNEPRFHIEFELWSRASRVYRELQEYEVRALIRIAGGEPERQSTHLPHIHYLGIGASFPTAQYNTFQSRLPELFYSPYLRRLRPGGGYCFNSPKADPTHVGQNTSAAVSFDTPPRMALIGASPDRLHPAVREGLLEVDPEDILKSYPTGATQLGTPLASLMLHGNLDEGVEQIPTRLLVRPLMVAKDDDWTSDVIEECLPRKGTVVGQVAEALDDLLLHHRADLEHCAAILMSLSAPEERFDGEVTPLARLLDWYAHTYGLLFVVSAGDLDKPLRLNLANEELYALQAAPQELMARTLQQFYERPFSHSLTAPAEAVNVLTIGASHTDAAPMQSDDPRYDLLQHAILPGPAARYGYGFSGAAKPEVHFPGGRQLFTDQFFLEKGKAQLMPSTVLKGQVSAPGLRVASSRTGSGEASETYVAGSMFAAALATRTAALWQERLRDELTGLSKPEQSALLKTLLVHDATQRAAIDWLRKHVSDTPASPFNVEQWIAHFLGHGLANTLPPQPPRPGSVRFFHTARVLPGEADRFALELPRQLLEHEGRRFMTLTLAWFSPTASTGTGYRKVQLWPDISKRNPLGLRSRALDREAIAEGTLWHEHFESLPRSRRGKGDTLHITLNAQAVVAKKNTRSKPLAYALVITLGTEPSLPLKVLFQQQTDSKRTAKGSFE